ncbi:hypothetical protein FA13DRAFT_1796298 [Coprinellus micaceus]|uniref:Uncharacterized protein n=1 Tax=Coprinellus micaceus TaxID=71717 RepID=A0A4Y7SUP8_COPMI|nr:hypothetical protein FA13DRAFT_1796298 [Coprinellus micaceus]
MLSLGVGLPQDDEVLASQQALKMWRIFKSRACNYELPGAQDEVKKIFSTIGKLGEEDLLSFFHLENRRRYLGCGCDLDHTTFDFILWKVAPPLFSETTPDAAECIGTPWDVRMRPTLIALFSSMGLRPDNLDKVMKYNIKGERNDLITAPEFVHEFWTLNRALKDAQWPKAVAPTPTLPRHRRRKAEFIDPRDMQDGEAVEFESDEKISQESCEPGDEGGGGSLCGGEGGVRGRRHQLPTYSSRMGKTARITAKMNSPNVL